MKGNKKYKDSVFRSIFNNKPTALELYNAVNGTNYTDESMVEINTLGDVLFAVIENDLSISIDKKIVLLVEHQSTINDNMPVRFLAYILSIYLRILGNKIYQEPLVKLPRPEFIVLYNGEDPFPKEKILRLSDAFEKTDNNDLISLDLTVRVININKGVNPELEGKSKTLNGYVTFIAKVREYAKKRPLEEAIKSAVDYCLKRGILTDFFEEHAQEVIKMIKIEYSRKDELKAVREAARNDGRTEGREEGREEGRKEGRKEGMEKIQNYVLELIEQGLSGEEIKKKIKKSKVSFKV